MYKQNLFPTRNKTDTTAQLEKGSSSPRKEWAGFSSPRKASVFVFLSVIPSISKGQESRVKECKPYKISFPATTKESRVKSATEKQETPVQNISKFFL